MHEFLLTEKSSLKTRRIRRPITRQLGNTPTGGVITTQHAFELWLARMKDGDVQPVYLPHNEPYLGSTSLLEFDLAIPRAMQVHSTIGPMTFSAQLTPLQRCATEIIPQGISIALSIRELIRQAYLFSAAILMRPLVERTGLMQYLVTNPLAVEAWHAGWPRKAQPTFDVLFSLVVPDASSGHREEIMSLMHKLVHTDPKSALFNMFRRNDGSLAFASGKVLSTPDSADVIAALAHLCLRRLTATSAFVFRYDGNGEYGDSILIA